MEKNPEFSEVIHQTIYNRVCESLGYEIEYLKIKKNNNGKVDIDIKVGEKIPITKYFDLEIIKKLGQI